MPHEAPEYVSARQRARNNASGANMSRLMRGQPLVREEDEVRPTTGRHHGNAPHDNYASPTEFFSGPRKPPHQSSGIRRNPDANRDTVGLMLTDEYILNDNANENGNGAQSYGVAAKRGQGAARARKARNEKNAAAFRNAHGGAGYRDGLTYNCIVTAPEEEWHSGVKITHPPGAMDAPYFEDTDPRPVRDVPPATGKRHVRPLYKDAKILGQAPPRKENEKLDFHCDLPPCHKTSNRANESVDVLNLYCYSPEELKEKKQPHKQLGPRKYVAPDMPPRKPPMIHPINTVAKQEHDVLGTGRWGVPEKQHPRGLGRGSCRPPRDTANIFRGGIAPAKEDEEGSNKAGARGGKGGSASQSRQVEPFHVNQHGSTTTKKRPDPVFNDGDHPRKALSKKNAGSPDLLRYYDPNVDGKPQLSPPKRNGQRSNQESRELQGSEIRPTGKGRGVFASSNRDSIVLGYAV